MEALEQDESYKQVNTYEAAGKMTCLSAIRKPKFVVVLH